MYRFNNIKALLINGYQILRIINLFSRPATIN